MDDAEPPGRPFGSAGLTLEVIDGTGRLTERQGAWLSERARRAAEHLGAAGDVRVRVVDDAEMARLHERYSKVAGTTDVLTFDLRSGPGALDADLVVCLDEASRQAGELGHAPERELLLYTVHGLLHCLGHDDHDEGGAARMHAMEDETLEAIGVGATYRARERAGAASESASGSSRA